LGFFIALAGYFSSPYIPLQNGLKILFDLGIVSSIAISILLCGIIFKNLFQFSTNDSNLIPISEFSFENVERFLFAIPFFMIVLILFYYIFQAYNKETYLTLILLAYVIAVPIYLKLYNIKSFDKHLYIIPTLIIFAGTIIFHLLEQYDPLYYKIIQAMMSTFVQMSLLLVVITFIFDVKKMLSNSKKKLLERFISIK
jgi:hypothetical protein